MFCLDKKNNRLKIRNRAMSKKLINVSYKLTLILQQLESFTKVYNYKQDYLQCQLSAAIRHKETLQDLISELAVRSRNDKFLENYVKRIKPMTCENVSGEDDVSEQLSIMSFEADYDSMSEHVSKANAPHQNNRDVPTEEVADVGDGMQTEGTGHG